MELQNELNHQKVQKRRVEKWMSQEEYIFVPDAKHERMELKKPRLT